MAFKDDMQDTFATMVGVGTITTGFAYAGYKTFKGTGAFSSGDILRNIPGGGLVSSIPGLGAKQTSGVAGPNVNPFTGSRVSDLGARPFISSVTRPGFTATLDQLEEVQRAGLAIMGEEGWRTTIKRAVKMSALGAGKLNLSALSELMEEIDSTSPDRLLGLIQAKEAKIGGLGGVYQSLEGLLGGRLASNRGRDLTELITNLGGTYTTSQFAEGGAFWTQGLKFGSAVDVEGLTATRISKLQVPTGAYSPTKYASELRETFASMGLNVEVTAGVREFTRDPISGKRKFLPGMAYRTARSTGPGQQVRLPIVELQLRMGARNTAYVRIPYARDGLIASGMGGMSTAAVRKFTIPSAGGSKQLVEWNESISMMLYGEGGQVGNNLATIIHNQTQEGKTLRQATEKYMQIVRSQVREITTLPHVRAGTLAGTGVVSTAGGRLLARQHQMSYVPLEETMERGLQPGSTYKTPELVRIMQAAEASGIGAYPMGSPSSTAKSAVMSQIPWHERYDIFGADFPYERRFTQKFRDFEPTMAAHEAMGKSRIYGKLSRNIPMTATTSYVKEVVDAGYSAPNVVMAYSLKKAKSLREEEILVSNALSEMMETQTVRTHWLSGEMPNVAPGTTLESGQFIGVDAKSGQPIYSKASPGMMTETVTAVERQGSFVKATVTRQFPLQQQTKIFDIKATLRPNTQGATQRLAEQEWGVATGARWGMPKAEAYGDVGLLKKNPAMVKRQMTEATLLLGAKRMAANEAAGRDIPESMRRVFGRGGRRYLQKQLTGAKGTFGVEEKLLSLAKGWGFTAEEMGWVAGYWLQLEEDKVKKLSGDALVSGKEQLNAVFRRAGITAAERKMIGQADFILGAPTFYFGDYPLLNPWERGSVDPRGIKELLLQDWKTEGGENVGRIIARELESRRLPAQGLAEMENVLYSMAGKGPQGLQTLSPEEAITRLKAGAGGFMMQVPGTEALQTKSVYVPSEARLMNYFTSEAGEELPQTLLSDYMKLANASIAQQAGEAGAQESLDLAAKGIRDSVYKQWLLSVEARGQIAGTTAPVMQSWLGRAQHFETAEEFAASAKAFTVGVGRETVRESFEDMIRLASTEAERTAIRKQMQTVMETGEGIGLVWRHPMIFPFSTAPVRYRITDQSTHGIHFPTITIGQKKVDVSEMLAMAADTDFDRANFAVVADQKVMSALDTLANDTRYKRQFAQVMEMQSDLETFAKENIGSVSTDYNKAEGLKRLASMQVATPEVSVAAQKLKNALHHAQSPEQKAVLSSLVTQLEQRAIQAKKGGEAEIISRAIRNTVTGFATGEIGLSQNKDEFKRAWMAIWGKEEFVAGGVDFNVNKMYNEIGALMEVANAGGHTEAYARVARRASRANRGAAIDSGSINEILRDLKAHRAGIGDPAAHLVRSMRQGTDGGVMVSNLATQATSRFGILKEGMKKNWKYPAMGIGAAIGARYLFGSNNLDIPEPKHDQKATEQILNMPKEPPPAPDAMGPPSIQTVGPNPMYAGMSGNFAAPSGSYSLQGTQSMMDFISSIGGSTNVTIRDNRGSITPEYIRKQMEERYY